MPPSALALLARLLAVRRRSEAIARYILPEDSVVQSMPEVSPSKWHLAHTSWFFEQFVLAREPGYQSAHPHWMVLFNSYYQTVGPQHPRARRGLLSRPTLAEILDYRHLVDRRLCELYQRRPVDAEREAIVALGIEHEQQHQELILTDIKHVLAQNPLLPALLPAPAAADADAGAVALRFLDGQTGIASIGHDGQGFAFDCETPRHPVLLHPHRIANRPVNNAEFGEFIKDGGYRNPLLWMAEGWDTVQRLGWRHPLYWAEDLQSEFSLHGPIALAPFRPVSHLSYFEADAFARWAGARLPREDEWEVLAAAAPLTGRFQEGGFWHPQPAADNDGGALQLFGDVWEWTASPFVSYPGYQPAPGALGEYNGKFMCGQWVLRGGSCVTPENHIRASYRNFFYPADRWQFTGVRLARDA
ncbi:MAG: ergothioneine biosynthesis protein EgtB [Lysobacterales bacterium]